VTLNACVGLFGTCTVGIHQRNNYPECSHAVHSGKSRGSYSSNSCLIPCLVICCPPVILPLNCIRTDVTVLLNKPWDNEIYRTGAMGWERRYKSSAWEFVYFITAVSTSSFGTGCYHHAKPKFWFHMLSFCIEIVDNVLARHICCIGPSCIHSRTVHFPFLETCSIRKWV
jgi:hypothetical protein